VGESVGPSVAFAFQVINRHTLCTTHGDFQHGLEPTDPMVCARGCAITVQVLAIAIAVYGLNGAECIASLESSVGGYQAVLAGEMSIDDAAEQGV
jgi:hypothetical protein